MTDPVILDGGTKMRRLREALPQISLLEFAVLFVLFEEADRKTGKVTIFVADLAAALRHHERTIERAVRRLADLHLLGIARGGGRGRANEYRLLPERAADAPPLEELKGRRAGHERAALDDNKGRQAGHDTLYPLITLESLPPSDGESADKMRSPGRCWIAMKGRLAAPERYGDAYIDAWFGDSQVEDITDGIVTFVEKTQFKANRNQRNHADMLLREWRMINPGIKDVRFRYGELPSRGGGRAEAQEREEQKVVSLREVLEAEAIAEKSGKIA